MAIDQLPTPPDRNDPATFSVRADAFVAALQTFINQLNAQIAGSTQTGSLIISNLLTDLIIGGTGDKFVIVNSTNSGKAGYSYQKNSVTLFREYIDPSTNDYVMERFNSGGVSQGIVTRIKSSDGTSPAQSAAQRSQMLADLLLVDGDSSGLDADMLDGYHASSFLQQETISYIVKSGHNSMALVVGGKLYTAVGNTVAFNNSTSGRGLNAVLGQVGLENLKIVPLPESTPIQKVGGFVHGFAYALLTNGNLYTWGQNIYGQCGLGHTNAVAIPTLAATGVLDVFDHPSNSGYEVGSNRLFIKKNDGYIYGTGHNASGALGLGDTTSRSIFTKITSLGTNVIGFWNMGANWGCCVAQKSDHTIWVSGHNANGQLGTGNATNQSAFIDVTSAWGGGTGKVLKKVIGSFGWHDGTNADGSSMLGMLLDDGTNTVFRMAGRNAWGGIGIGSVTATDYSTPQTPSVGTGRVSDIAGIGSPLTVNVLKADGTLYVFGHNGQGQLGIGSTSNVGNPTIATTNVLELLADGINSNSHAFYGQGAIRKADGVYMCGFNDSGYCGVGNTSTPITSFTKTLLPANFMLKFLGSHCTSGGGRIYVAVSTDNSIYAWGFNAHYGLLDSAYTNAVSTPIYINSPRG